MNGEFLDVLQQIARDKEIPLQELIEMVEVALATAYRRSHFLSGEVKVKILQEKGNRVSYRVYMEKTVVDHPTTSPNEISLQEARKIRPGVNVGEQIEIDLPSSMEEMGRIAAQTARNVVLQRIREAERHKTYEEFADKVDTVVTGTVHRREGRNVIVHLGKVDAILPPQEQVETEPYDLNDRIKVYVLEVRETPRGPQVIVSRTHPGLIRRLFELEVPEIEDGTVIIKSVVREPGARSKVAVMSRDEKVDAQGACIGPRGIRVQNIVNELYNEKIDIVRWSPDDTAYIAESLSPAKVTKVELDPSTKSALVVVPDNKLSLAIGKSGQNVRLAARLTGWRIDIRSESQLAKASQPAEADGKHPQSHPLEEHGTLENPEQDSAGATSVASPKSVS